MRIVYPVAVACVFIIGVPAYRYYRYYDYYEHQTQIATLNYQECQQHLNAAVLEINKHASDEQDIIVLREKLEFADRRLKDVEDRNQELERRLVNGK